MKKKWLYLILSLMSIKSFALTQNEKLWLGVNVNQIHSKHWATFIFAQLRTINESHPIQVGLVEGGIGYKFIATQSLWVGYRWSGYHFWNDFYQENRLFQQYINLITPNLASRTRLEEIKRGSSSQIAVRLRQRLALEIEKELFININPYLYEELFFQLHPTQFTSNKFISENRLFIGVNWQTSEKNWWEIGYINQFQMQRDNQNTMSHIASFTYNIS